jgi:FAD:protein FMN transferase
MPNQYQEQKKLFGTYADFRLYDVDEIFAKDILERVYNEGLRLQKIFNYYDTNSELSKLNNKRNIKASEELIEVIKKALEMCELTEGEYDISMGMSIDKRKTGQKDIKMPSNYKAIIISGKNIVLGSPDIKIDLGSIAKGYIVDKMIKFLKEEGILSGLIDARGDIRIFGDTSHIFGIQHPRDKEQIIEKISLKNASVATSGDYNQYYGSYDKSHILNSKDLISVTVVADSLMEADLFATAFFVCREELKQRLIKIFPHLRVLTYNKELKSEYYNNFEALMTK